VELIMNGTLILIALLFTKHFVIDFPLQKPYQWQNKGTYGHPGGILHSGLHGIGTYFCFVWFAPVAAIYLALIDAVIHYHIDWAKMNLNARMGWGANTHEQFWWLLGLDQFLHALTYVGLVALVTV
jgi:hypothetical protein